MNKRDGRTIKPDNVISLPRNLPAKRCRRTQPVHAERELRQGREPRNVERRDFQHEIAPVDRAATDNSEHRRRHGQDRREHNACRIEKFIELQQGGELPRTRKSIEKRMNETAIFIIDRGWRMKRDPREDFHLSTGSRWSHRRS